MELEENYVLSLHFTAEEAPILKSMIEKLFNNPESIGYGRKKWTKKERDLLDQLAEAFGLEEKAIIDNNVTTHTGGQYAPEE